MSKIVSIEPGLDAAPVTKKTRGGFLWQVIKDRPSAAIGFGMVLFFVIIAFLSHWLEPYSIHNQTCAVYAPPSATHWLGCDDGGIDMVSLLIEGAKVSLIVGFAATFVSMVIGGGIGILAGYFGGAVDIALMRLTDYFLVIPDVPLAIIVAAVWGPSLSHLIFVIALLLWTGTARIIRSQVKSVRERVYVKRSRSLGAGNSRMILRHVLPQIGPLLIANVVLTVAVAIFDETALSFLGLGDPTRVSWGTILEHAFDRTAISSGAWWAVVPDGICITVVIMGAYLLGQAIEDALNPRLKVSYLSIRHFGIRPLPARDRDPE